MQITYGLDAAQRKKGINAPVVWDSKTAVNGHILLVGMSGAGKTYRLKQIINSMRQSCSAAAEPPPRFHVFDVHGDIDLDGASSVLFSEQTPYGLNPLRVDPDPHFGGIRKRIQAFISTINRVNQKLGQKQEAVLRNILTDVYARHGFHQDDPSTWVIEEAAHHRVESGDTNRLYLDIPFADKDQAKAFNVIGWDKTLKLWYINPKDYRGGITRWAPKTLSRTHPSISDVLRVSRHILMMNFLGTGQEAVTNLEIVNKKSHAYRHKLFNAIRQYGSTEYADEKTEADIQAAKEKAIESYTRYIDTLKTGLELEGLMKYSSKDVLKSVVERLENLDAVGIFQAEPPPFDEKACVWRYNLRALSKEEKKLFVHFRLEELFLQAMQQGEQQRITNVFIVDESHLYIDDAPDNIIKNISAEGRKFGLALVCASQSPTHFPEDFMASVATKIILGIDEMYWKSSTSKMGVSSQALSWVQPQRRMLVQIKAHGNTRNDWHWTLLNQHTATNGKHST